VELFYCLGRALYRSHPSRSKLRVCQADFSLADWKLLGGELDPVEALGVLDQRGIAFPSHIGNYLHHAQQDRIHIELGAPQQTLTL